MHSAIKSARPHRRRGTYSAPAGAEAEEPGPVVITVRTVEIVKVFKGDLKAGDTIKVKELGGQFGGISYVEHEATPLVKEKTYALFLQTYPDAPASLLNSQQGKYLVTGALQVTVLLAGRMIDHLALRAVPGGPASIRCPGRHRGVKVDSGTSMSRRSYVDGRRGVP